MKPDKDADAVVDLLDTLLDEGAVVQADVLLTVADVPLVGIKLRAAIAGMATMAEYGIFEDWDEAVRRRSGGPGSAERARTDRVGGRRDREQDHRQFHDHQDNQDN